ncbi:MAG: hypothetical protein HC897_18385 [Thermoanaerobaculia bacterium]|nr:hypothetical protein [Thermoanaerobaculia bacterium]
MRNALVLLIAILLASPVVAGELAGVKLDDSAQVGASNLVLNGMGLRTKLGFKVYVGGLYLGAKQSDPAKILADDSARRTVMHFVRSVGSGKICDGWQEGLAGNTPSASAEVKKGFETLCSYTEDVSDGDQMVFTYVPGTGTEVAVKGKSKGTIAGKPFADALFAVWIGPKPPTAELKKGLLGG